MKNQKFESNKLKNIKNFYNLHAYSKNEEFSNKYI